MYLKRSRMLQVWPAAWSRGRDSPLAVFSSSVWKVGEAGSLFMAEADLLSHHWKLFTYGVLKLNRYYSLLSI